jgi:haloalkane dehalogenase
MTAPTNGTRRALFLNWDAYVGHAPFANDMGRNGRWYESENDIPKLFINGDPGAILHGARREFCRGWKNQDEVTVKGRHFLQEDSSEEIGRSIRSWLGKHKL